LTENRLAPFKRAAAFAANVAFISGAAQRLQFLGRI
jgi:hypothetical protein